jgi:hypothetical protein
MGRKTFPKSLEVVVLLKTYKNNLLDFDSGARTSQVFAMNQRGAVPCKPSVNPLISAVRIQYSTHTLLFLFTLISK